jgi:hypothetical protein
MRRSIADQSLGIINLLLATVESDHDGRRKYEYW